MSKATTIPRLGQVLRAAIKAAGLRHRIDALGLGKDLDDLAIEARPGATFRLIQEIEDACTKAVSDDAGPRWGEVFRSTWGHTRRSMQHLVQSAAIDAIPAEEGRALYERLVTVPALSGYLSYCQSESRGPDLDIWWTSPFKAWVQFASSIAGVPAERVETNLANHLDVDQRTLDRWAAGEPIGTICWPYRPTVLQAIGEQTAKKIDNDAAQRLTGWLMMAVAFQSLSPACRDTVRRDFSMHSQVQRSVDDAVSAINQRALTCGAGPIRTAAIPILERIEHLFDARQPQHAAEIREQLKVFNAEICKLEPEARQSYQYIHDWFSARLAATEGKSNAALRLYRAAVEAVWWSGGQNQHPILNEALLYAVGIGDKVAAEHYWDKTFLLGLNSSPKRPLEEQELRRIASGFEKMFHPQKATHRIPPPIEAVFQDQDFRLDPKDLSNPNRKVKFAEGRIRRTPFMDAIRDGTLDDVKQMLAAGGDPDDYIKESGEGPLSFAMRRACDRKDPAIMNYLLGLDLLPETVNRPVSTKRESPLKIAIEMADADAVARLIALGADIERHCDQVPSALCYAMLRLHESLHREDPAQEMGYVMGKSRGDIHDARDGAVLDTDLAGRRRALLAMTYASPTRRRIFEAVKDYFIRPADSYRQVILTLLQGGADANRRYRVEADHIEEWTPTLFAAEVGDLEVFRMLVEHPGSNRGDPDLTLRTKRALERMDAMWVAVGHGRHSIVSYLVTRQQALAG